MPWRLEASRSECRDAASPNPIVAATKKSPACDRRSSRKQSARKGTRGGAAVNKDIELLATFWTIAGGALPHTDKEYSPYGIVEACIGGGQGIALLLENPR